MLQASLRDGTWRRRCVFELFARRLPDRPPLRRGGRDRPVPRRAAAVQLRRRGTGRSSSTRRSSTPTRSPGSPTTGSTGDIWGLRRGRDLLPRLTAAGGRGHASPRPSSSRRSRCRSTTTTARSPRRRPGWCPPPRAARSSRWARGAPTRRRRSPRPARPTSPASTSTSNLEAGRRYGVPDPRHQRARVHAAARRRAGGLPSPGRLAGRRRPRCSSTPTTSRPASPPGSRSPAPRLGAVRIDSGDLAEECRRVRRPARRPRRHGHPDRRHRRPRRVRHRRAASAPVDGYGVGTSLVTGNLDPRGDTGGDVVGVDEQRRVRAERLDLALERGQLVVVQEHPGVRGRARRRDAVAAFGLQVRRGREAREVRRPRRRDRRGLVRAPRPHLDDRPTGRGGDHAGRGRGDGAVVVEDRQGEGLQHDGVGERADHREDAATPGSRARPRRSRRRRRRTGSRRASRGCVGRRPSPLEYRQLLVVER